MLVPCSFHPTWLLFSFSSGEQSPNLKLLIIGIISSETPWEEQTENGFLASPCWLLETEMQRWEGLSEKSLCPKLQEAFLVLLTPLARSQTQHLSISSQDTTPGPATPVPPENSIHAYPNS